MQVAFESQPSKPLSHSGMSETRYETVTIHISRVCTACLFYTCAVESISFEAFPTCAVEAAISVSAVGIGTARIYLQVTLIDICRLNKSMKRQKSLDMTCIHIKSTLPPSLRDVNVPLTCFQERGKLGLVHKVKPRHVRGPLGWIARVHIQIQGSPL